MSTIKNTFEQTLKAWEADPTNGDKLMNLANAVATSVLRKVADPQRMTGADGDKTRAAQNSADKSKARAAKNDPGKLMRELSAAMARDLRHLDNLRGSEAESVPVDYVLSDGADLAQTAALALWEAYESTPDHAPGWVERTYTIRAIRQRVFTIQGEDKALFVDKETTPIQEAYRATRRAIEDARAVTVDPSSPFVYVEDTREDVETGEAVEVYTRCPRFTDLGGYETDANGAETVYTAGAHDLRNYAALRASLDLNARQAAVLRMREQGASLAEIAQALKIQPAHVTRTVQQIRAKASKAWGVDASARDLAALRAAFIPTPTDPPADPADLMDAHDLRAAHLAAVRARTA